MPYKNPEDAQRYRDAHREKAKAYAKAFYANHQERWSDGYTLRQDTSNRQYGPKQQAARREYGYKAYGLTVAEVEARIAEQDNRCLICGDEFVGHGKGALVPSLTTTMLQATTGESYTAGATSLSAT